MPHAIRIGRAGATAALILGLLVPAASASLIHAGVQATGPGMSSLIAPGDTISIVEQVRNTGSAPVSGLTATLTSSTATVPGSGNVSTYPSIGPDAVAQNDRVFTASLPNTLPCGASVDFALAMSGGSSDTIGFSVSTGIAGPPQPFPTLDGPLAVPDSGEKVTSTVDVPTSGRIKSLRVHVNSLQHNSDRDMSLVLVGPDGTTVTLLSKGQAASGANFSDTVFEATGGSVGASSAPYTGSYRASGDLTKFIGADQRGLWRLELVDNSANGFGGLLDGWSLEIDPPVCDARAQAGFTATPNPVGAGFTAHFDASSSQDPQTKLAHYVWDFGDGTPAVDTGTTPTVDHLFDLPRGRKTVTLEMQDASHVLLSKASVNVFVDQPPVAVLDATTPVASIDDPCTLDASRSTFDPAADPTKLHYDFDLDGNGVFETPGTTPTLPCGFTTSGTHTVNVRVTDDVGASKVAQKTITVGNLAPVARFVAPSGWQATGTPIGLDASTSTDRDGAGGKPVTYQWDFDYAGGTPTFDTQPLASPTTTFTPAGSGDRTVLLQVVDAQGDSGTATQLIHVTDPPAIALAASPSPAPKGAVVVFDTTGSIDPDGSIVRWDWDLDGDGKFEIVDGGPSQSISYPTFGDRDVQVRATDDHDVTATKTVRLSVPNHPPAARITATPNPAQTGQTVTFDASGSSDADGPIVSYAWDLDGDGSFETQPSGSPAITASYPNPGHVDVRVKVTDADGGSGVEAVGLDVVAPPLASLGGSGGGLGEISASAGAAGAPAPNAGATVATVTTGSGSAGATAPGSAPGEAPTGSLSAGLSGAAVQSLKLALRKGIALGCQIDRPATCTVSLTIKASDARRLRVAKARGATPVVIGTATLKAARAGTATIIVRLTGPAARRLRRVRKLVVQATGTARDAGGSTVKLARGLVLRG